MSIPTPPPIGAPPSSPPLPDVRSCATCPSFLEPHEVPNKFNRATGSPMCGRFGTVLGKPSFTRPQELALQQEIGTSCDQYGSAMPPQPMREMYVMLPDPELRDPSKIADDLKLACTSCGMCKNLISESVVVSATGWTTGLCAARGKLIFSNKQAAEATGCEYRQYGQVRQSMGGLHFLPHYSDDYGIAPIVSPTTAYFDAKNTGEFVDPSEWPTDYPVSVEDEALGIRAWRRVDDPEGSGNSVNFPIYRRDYFSHEEQALIPATGSEEHPELYLDHFGGLYGLGVAWFELEETPVFWGMPGIGKTELLRYAAWIMQLPFHRISFTATSEVDDTIGKMMFSPEKGTYFHYGRLARGWTSAGILCLDEPNTSPPEVWQEVRPLTDNSKQMIIDQSDKPFPLDKHPGCFMGMAMNPAWDVRNLGALEIADADANRLFHTYIEMPPPEMEREIIQARVRLDGWELTPQQLDNIMGVAEKLRGLSNEQQLPITWAIRPQIKVARALRWFSPTTAYRRAAGDYLNPEALQIMLDQVRAIFPKESN